MLAAVNPISICGFTIASLAGLSILPPVLFVELVLFCVMIPLFVVGMALLNLAFSWRLGRILFGILLGIWLLAMIFCSVVVAANIRYLSNQIDNRGGIIEWLDDRYDENEEQEGMFQEFLDREDNGLNNITINIAQDSIEVVSWRDHSADSTYISPDGVLKYESHISIKNLDKKMRGGLRTVDKRLRGIFENDEDEGKVIIKWQQEPAAETSSNNN
jgi:hypothetical protein